MRIINASILIFLLVVSIAGCEKETGLKYGDVPALYFKYSDNLDEIYQRDSLDHSFFLVPKEEMRDTVLIYILTMGNPADDDRPFELVLANAGQPKAAVPGKHFVAFDDPEMKEHFKISKGAVGVYFPLIVLRDPSLDTDTIRFELKLVENSYFKTGIDAWTRFVVKTTSQATKPANWNTLWRYHFGLSWGTEKMRFIITMVGLTDFDTRPESGYAAYLSAKAKQKLLEYNAAHPKKPLAEADGTLVTFDN